MAKETDFPFSFWLLFNKSEKNKEQNKNLLREINGFLLNKRQINTIKVKGQRKMLNKNMKECYNKFFKFFPMKCWNSLNS